MKKSLFFLAFLVALVIPGTSALAIDSCADFVSNVDANQDWRTIGSIIDDEGFEWKRAIISRPTDALHIVCRSSSVFVQPRTRC